MPEVPAPLFISSRLMAALKVEGAGTIHVGHVGTDRDGRQGFEWVIEDAEGHELETGGDLRSGCGDDVDYRKTMATLLSFLTTAAEAYRWNMSHGDGASENSDLFCPAVMEWAYMNDSELQYAEIELEGDES